MKHWTILLTSTFFILNVFFIYHTGKNAITERYKFNIDSDYEGITRVDRTIYMLKSDGVLFEITDYDSKDFKWTFIR